MTSTRAGRSGAHARVQGTRAGKQVGFDVRVGEADDEQFSLVATGPVTIDARYTLLSTPDGSLVRAAVNVHGEGLFGSLLARATAAILPGGPLSESTIA